MAIEAGKVTLDAVPHWVRFMLTNLGKWSSSRLKAALLPHLNII